VAESQPTGISRIEPYLYYEDVAAAVDWLTQAFGFRETGERFANDDGIVIHAAMEHDGGVLMLGWPGPDYQSPKRTGQREIALYVYVDDVDAHYRRAKAAGATITEEPNQTEYGHQRYSAEDLDGHSWAFAKPL
jgi:PhnB protein